MSIDIQSALVHTSRQGRVEALSQSFSYDQFPWDLLELHVRLKRLYAHHVSLSLAHERSLDTHLEQLLEKRDAVCPFVDIVEGVEALVDLLGVLLVLWVGSKSLLRRCCWSGNFSHASGLWVQGDPPRSLVRSETHAVLFLAPDPDPSTSEITDIQAGLTNDARLQQRSKSLRKVSLILL